MRTKLRPHPTSMLTLTTSRRKKPPPSNAQMKRKLVRARGCTSEGWRVFEDLFTTVDGYRDSEKKDGIKGIVC